MRTTASWFDSFDTVSRLLDLGPGARLWVPGPLTATMNLFAAVHAAFVGGTLTPSPDAATHALLTPAALARTIAQGTDLRGAHLLVAGDRLTPRLHDEAVAHGTARVSHYYGAAELSFVAWGTHAEDLAPFPGVEVESRDGRLWARSPYLMHRYDGPDGPLLRGADGFVTVGDRGDVTEGRVLVHGRGSDAVVTAGATVLVADVEAVLERVTRSPVVVVGTAHPDLGQVLCGVLHHPDDLAAARAAARELLEPAQRPRRWYALGELPLTVAGKVDRGRLTALLDVAVPLAAP